MKLRFAALAFMLLILGMLRGSGRFPDDEAMVADPTVELLSLQPTPLRRRQQFEDCLAEEEHRAPRVLRPAHTFHGYEVLGSKPLPAADRARLLAELRGDLRWPDRALLRTRCLFEPRTGLRGRDFSLAVCFRCRQLAIYRGDAQVAFLNLSDGTNATFRHMLEAARVPLAEGWSR